MVKNLTQKEVREAFDYNSKTGILTRRGGRPSRRAIGEEVGRVDKSSGYKRLHYLGKRYRVHRIIWLWVYGVMPKEIDHIDHNHADNRLSNLRDVNHQENGQNTKLPITNTSGVCGVSWRKRELVWVAYIGGVYLGRFLNFEDAVAARKEAEIRLGYHENHGKKIT